VIGLVRAPEQPAAQQPPTRHPIIRVSPRLVIGIVSAVVLVAAASVGSAVWPASKAQAVGATKASTAHSESASSATLGSFGWLASTAPPATWARLTVPSGLGTLSSPPGFRTVDGDPGTLSLALRNSAGTYLGYLNVTPHQGHETLRDWAAFRLSHLLDDDAVFVHEDAMVQSVATATAMRSCVTDDYVTTIGHHHFHEVACYVTSGSVSSVVVAATPSGDPAHTWTQLERAVAAYPFG
jgi:large exoprotein involved in heme utilization and adhesion